MSVNVSEQVLPVHDVGKEVIMFESVVRVDSIVVDGESASPDAPFVLGCRVSSELSGEDVQDLLSNPPSFGKRSEREVVRVYFSETCKNDISHDIPTKLSGTRAGKC